ncbi:hypothetical protein ALQ07_04706, partial [Pseudomonas syringae pv. actinidiae]
MGFLYDTASSDCMMDEDFAFFLEKFAPATGRDEVPESSIAKYKNKLPDQLLVYCLK